MTTHSLIRRDDIGYVLDMSDEVLVLRKPEPIPGYSKGTFLVYHAKPIEQGDDFCLVVVEKSTENDRWSYHADTNNPRDAKKNAIKALRLQQCNRTHYSEYMSQVMAWLEQTGRPFIQQDAQDAGFGKLGVQQLLDTYGLSHKTTISSHEVLRLIKEDKRIAMVAFDAWRKEYSLAPTIKAAV